MFTKDKNSSLLGPLVTYKEKEVLWTLLQSPDIENIGLG
jgi:hypothetical protein